MGIRSRARRGSRSTAAAVGREPGIWRGAYATGEYERPPLQQIEQGRVFVSWRIFSGLLVVSLLLVLFVFFSSDAFYVHSIGVSGLRYMTVQEIFGLANIANVHVFWVDPQEVRANLLRSPAIANAAVNVGWGVPMVQIVIEEREPALVWEQAGVVVWVDLQGRIMRLREDRDDLLRVIVDGLVDGPPQGTIDTAIINGALQLHDLLPNQPVLRYHPDKGLGYTDPRGWPVWLGTGTDMPEKILIYNAIIDNLQSRGINPLEVNVTNPDAPFYSLAAR